MRNKLLLLSFSLCVQTEGQAAVKELGELGFPAARRIVLSQMKRPVSTISSFQYYPKQFSQDTTAKLDPKPYSIFMQRRNMSTLNERVYEFASNCSKIEKEQLANHVRGNCKSMSDIQDPTLIYCRQQYDRLDTISKDNVRELHEVVDDIVWTLRSRLKELDIISKETGDFADDFPRLKNSKNAEIDPKVLKLEFENIFKDLGAFFRYR